MRVVSRSFVPSLAALAALWAAGCGSGGPSLTEPEPSAPSAGSAVIQGTVSGGGVAASSVHASSSGAGTLRVSVVGTSLATDTDSEGQFVLTGVGTGPATLRFEGAGVDARLSVSGLVNGQILTVHVHVAGSSAQLVSPPANKPTQDMKFSGTIESVGRSRIVVAGRTVEDHGNTKCSRGDYRIAFGDLKVGEKVTVWGTLQPSGVVHAYEVAADGPSKPKEPQGQSVSFKGRVDSVAPLRVAGTKVRTDGGTRFKWSDGTPLDPGQIVVGDQAYVEGTKLEDGSVQASKVMVDCR
jgi:Domain of unknown function (DUF5666)